MTSLSKNYGLLKIGHILLYKNSNDAKFVLLFFDF